TLHIELNQISKSLSAWMIVIAKEKAVYGTLNLFSYDPARRTLIAEGWCPTTDIAQIKTLLQDVTNRAGLSIPSVINQISTTKTPPTFLRTNKFTEGFQTIVNAYGTATYREVNPVMPVIVTFPFLFAVMFGDIGHALMMLAASLAMIKWEKSLKKVTFELFAMVFYGRYIALLMAIFSIFTGFMYNDIFSFSLTLFTSAWKWDHHPMGHGDTVVGELIDPSYRYPFGLDHMWHGTDNNLIFTNSYKMKMSVILGWAHMTYSLCLSYINSRHLKKKEDLWGNFVPGMIFFQSIFGYLIGCIIYKWTVNWQASGRDPPGLLNMLIFMFLSPSTLDGQLYPGQQFVQNMLLLIALAQVPLMLGVKPYILWRENQRLRGKGYRAIGETSHIVAADSDDEEGAGRGANGHRSLDEGSPMITENIDEGAEHEEFELSEVIIHQVIHTIGKFLFVSCRVCWGLILLTGRRILPQLRLAHGLVPPSLGALACPPAAEHGPLDHDDRALPRMGRLHRHLHGCLWVRRVVLPQCVPFAPIPHPVSFLGMSS
ncbi:V-type ATPase subunit a family protein, partial [Candidatus Bathyarchaeota archaeon]|nr:V-type ATPase subunit a family protein [Candidatus Bathyarchaeota archaeon]